MRSEQLNFSIECTKFTCRTPSITTLIDRGISLVARARKTHIISRCAHQKTRFAGKKEKKKEGVGIRKWLKKIKWSSGRVFLYLGCLASVPGNFVSKSSCIVRSASPDWLSSASRGGRSVFQNLVVKEGRSIWFVNSKPQTKINKWINK